VQSPKDLGTNFEDTDQGWCHPSRVSGMFYKAVVQSILLFGSETWVVTTPMLKALESFHQRVARRMARKQPYCCRRTDKWIYPPIEEALEEVGLYSVSHCIGKRQNTVADYVATRPIFDLCRQAEISTGSKSSRRWWDQVEHEVSDDIVEEET
jgi:hypothetical protein